MNKRGVSDVITTVLIILLVLAAVAIIGGIILKNLGDASEKIEAGFNTVSLSIPQQSVKIDPATGLVNLNVQRNAGQGNVKAFNVILEDSSGQRSVIRVDQPIAELETKSVQVTYSGLTDVKKISISPIIQTSKGNEFQSEILTTTQLSGSEPIAVPQGLVGYWKFDETSGMIASDSSGNSQTANLVSSGELVKDGGAESGVVTFNWNGWKGTAPSVHDGSDSFYSEGISSSSTVTVLSKEFIPVDVSSSTTYTLAGWFKSYGTGGRSNFYFGLAPYDASKTAISPQEVDVILGTETTLYEAVKPGDTTIKIVKDANGNWRNWKVYVSGGVTYDYHVIAFNIDDSGNYNDLPNRDYHRGINKVEDKGTYLELSLSYSIPTGKSYSSGTKVREQAYGGTYIYTAASPSTVDDWTKFSGTIQGEKLYGTAKNQWRRGTKYAKIIILPNYLQSIDYKMYADDISLTSVPVSYTGPLQIAGKIGNALSFDGYDDYAKITDSDNLDLTDKFTIAFWVKRESGAGIGVISKDGVGDTFGAYNVYISSNGNVQYEVNNNGPTISSTTTIPLNAWSHVAVTFDDSLTDKKLKIYIDGVEAGSGNPVQPSVLGTDLLIGKRGLGSYFKGTIDELTIYKKTLSGEEVKTLYDRTK
ncbi:MAG: LamG domain-containing protein [Nanoarchaeota archaeon]